MRTTGIVLGLLFTASTVSAAVIHDESVDGDLATDPSAPTAVAFAVGSNTINGTVENVTALDRDYITFTIASNQILTNLNLLGLSPDNIAFTAFNAGATSFIPGGATIGSFLAGIHISAAQVGTDLMPLFDTASVTTNSLSAPMLGPGTYCFMIQQTSPVSQAYSLEFVMQSAVPTEPSTWGGMKARYR